MSLALFVVKKKASYFRTKIYRLSFPFFSPFPLLFSLSLFLTSPLFLFSFAEMTTKFNQEFYTRIKAKKNEPLSNIGQCRLRVVEKEKENEVTENGLSTPALDEGQVASSALFLKEITPCHKKRKISKKGKEKVGASVWANVGMALVRANEIVTPDELKEIFGVPSHEMVNHVHKIVLVTFLHFPSLLVLFF